MNTKILFPIWLLLSGLIYFYFAPIFCQGGDTSELVSHSYKFYLIHPPGYPLFQLYLYIFTHLPINISIFLKASLGCIILSLFTQFFLWSNSSKTFKDLFLLILLATSSQFWNYSILPDVFMGFCFYMCIFLILPYKKELLNSPWYLLLMASSVAHHHLIIFFLPCATYAWFYSEKKIKIVIQSVIFLIFSFSIYGVLFLVDSDHINSWHKIETFKDLLHHFLRSDYGTFQLSIIKTSGNFLDTFYHFIKYFVENYWGVLIIVCLEIKNILVQIKNKDTMVSISSLLIYIFIFSFLSQFDFATGGENEEIFKRFLLAPSVGFIFFSMKLIKNISKLGIVLLVLNISVNIFFRTKDDNFRRASIIEDLSINTLIELPINSVIIMRGDAAYFSSIYVQQVLGIRNDVTMISDPSFSDRSRKKLLNKVGQVFTVKDGILNMDVFKTPIFTNSPEFFLPKGNTFNYFGLSSQFLPSNIKKSTLTECRDFSTYKTRFKPDDFPYSYNLGRWNYGKYSKCHFLKGLIEFNDKKYDEALSSFNKIISFDPDFIPAIERKCEIYKITGNSEKFKECDKYLDQKLIENDIINFKVNWIL